MDKHNRLELVMSLIYILLVLIIRGAYLYFGEGFTALEAILRVGHEVGNLLVVFAIGFPILILLILISSRVSKKKPKRNDAHKT